MNQSNQTRGSVNRRKILYWATGTLSSLLLWRFTFSGKKKNKTVKMLSEDGQLVEVDIRHLKAKSRSIKPDEIHTWIKRKNK